MLDFKLNAKRINELSKDITNCTDDIQDKLIDIKTALKSLNIAAYEYDSAARKENPYFVKSVVKYVANGYSESDAIAMTATDFKTSIARVQAVYNSQKQYTAAVKLYARKYCVKMLRESGFPMGEIAKILKISPTHAHRLFKSKCIF